MISALLISLFVVLLVAGVPVSVALLLATAAAMLTGGEDLMAIPQQMASSVRSLELMAIPFFILSAHLMTHLGMTRRIFDFAEALVGWIRGGLAHANVAAGFIFSGIPGPAVAGAPAGGARELHRRSRSTRLSS